MAARSTPGASNPAGARPRICQVLLKPPEVSETFLVANAQRLPADVTVVYGVIPHVGGRPVLPQNPLSRIWRKAQRTIARKDWNWELTLGFVTAFRRSGAQAVLAEYGPAGVGALEACRYLGLPLIVHFRGYDASRRSCLQTHAQDYQRLFAQAAAIVAVSRAMCRRLIELGAPAGRVHYRPSGAACERFGGADPGSAPPTFVAVGRLVEKKAPHLTLLAFAEVHRRHPEARLRIIGDGPLRSVCDDLVRALRLEDAVTFLGAQPHERVQEEMRLARVFVQHSVEAANGDSEGTPVAVMEAGATGLPVVSTRHAGIPEVVLHEDTGLLVEERDVSAMAGEMIRLVEDPKLAARLGRAGQQHIRAHFSVERTTAELWRIIEQTIASG